MCDLCIRNTFERSEAILSHIVTARFDCRMAFDKTVQ